MASNDYTVGFVAPALPYPPEEYSAFEFEQFNKVLRLYFTQVDNTLRDRSLANQTDAIGWFLS
jgi:hypothetical protein|tara:strand:+ start:1182 stop:1370 length:189 start_codon:yes stop_codon:yes gene_type:complete